MRSQKVISLFFPGSGPQGAPGWSQGPSQGAKSDPKARKSDSKSFRNRVPKPSTIDKKSKRMGLRICLESYWTRGENLRWMPPRCFPDASQIPPIPLIPLISLLHLIPLIPLIALIPPISLIQLASPRPPRQGRFFEKKNAKSRKFSRATVPVTLLTTLKNLLFRVSLKIANGNGVREQPSL